MRSVSTCALLLALQLSHAASAGTYAVIIGISRYQDATSIKPLQFGDADAKSFAGLLKTTPPKTATVPCPALNLRTNIQVLTNEQACAATIRESLQTALQAGPNDTVYLFISARGIATNDLADGFLLGYDSRRETAAASGLSVNQVERDPGGKVQKPLGDLIGQSKAGKIYLFADVARDPTELNGQSNLINLRLSDLQNLKRKGFYVVLGSQAKQLSRECKGLGGGVFDQFLVQILKSGQLNQATLKELSDKMANPGPGCVTSPPQRPWVVPPIPAGASLQILQPISRVYRRSPILIAFYGPPLPGLLAGLDEDQESTGSDPFEAVQDALANRQLDKLQALEKNFKDPERLSFAVAMENAAQQVFVTYGEGDQFPNDPLRPGKPEFDFSAELFQMALETRPTQPSANPESETKLRNSLTARMVFCRARSLIFDSRYSDALTELQKSPETDWLAESYNAQGIAYLEQADYPDAIQAFIQSIRLAPDWAYSRHNLALAHIENGDYSAAERDYGEAIRRTPYHPYLYYNLGVLLHRLNRKKEAEQAYQAAIRKFTEQEANFHARAQEWKDAGNEIDSKRASQREDVLKQNEAEAHNSLGAVLEAEGHWERAEDQYNASLKLNGNLNVARYNLGALQAERPNSLASGIQTLADAVRSDPDFLPARLKLADAYRAQGALQEAIDLLRSAPAKWLANSEVQFRLSEIQGDLDVRQGRKSDACSLYKQASDKTTGSPSRRRLQKKRKSACGSQ